MNALPKRDTFRVASGGLFVSPLDEDLFESPIEEFANVTALIGDGE
jgi:hypothetical protein